MCSAVEHGRMSKISKILVVAALAVALTMAWKIASGGTDVEVEYET